MGKLSEKQLLIVTIVVAVLVAGGLGFLIWKDLQAIEEEEATISKLQQDIAAAQREIDQIPSREFKVIANREISEREVAFLPAETEIETYWQVLERYSEEAGVNISKISQSGKSAGRGRRKRRKGGRSPITQVDQLLSIRGSMDEFLKFINLLENHDRIINVMEFDIKTGQKDEEGVARHPVRLALRTFTYPRKIANTIVAIPNYEKKKEHVNVKKELRRIKVQEIDTYTLRSSHGRRDPLVNVRHAPEAIPVEPEADRNAQEEQLQLMIDNVRMLQDGLEIEKFLTDRGLVYQAQLQKKKNLEMYNVLQRQIEQVRRKPFDFDDLRERFQNEVVVPFDAIRERMGKFEEEAPKLTVDQVKKFRDDIAAAFDEQDWKKVEGIFDSFKSASKGGGHVVDEARVLAAEIAEYHRKSKVIRAVAKRKILITTIIFNPRGNSLAVINGKELVVGDALDAEGRIVVSEIGENYVIFETEGVEIKRDLNQK